MLFCHVAEHGLRSDFLTTDITILKSQHDECLWTIAWKRRWSKDLISNILNECYLITKREKRVQRNFWKAILFDSENAASEWCDRWTYAFSADSYAFVRSNDQWMFVKGICVIKSTQLRDIDNRCLWWYWIMNERYDMTEELLSR